MRAPALFVIVVLLGFMILVGFVLFSGCAVAVNPATVITGVEVAVEITKKVKELQASDAPPHVLNEVYDALVDVHQIVDMHHQVHVKGAQ